MAKVYVVESGWWRVEYDGGREEHLENSAVEGVFESEDKAIDYMLNIAKDRSKILSERGLFTREVKRESIKENVFVYHTLIDIDRGGYWVKFNAYVLQ